MKYFTIGALMLSSVTMSPALLADGSKVVLGGYCPVGYVAAQKTVYGDPKYASEYKGKTYYLSSQGAKEMFDKEPEKFTKSFKYDSYCATGVALGKKLATDPGLFSTAKGKVYLFSSPAAKEAFDKDPKGMIAKAEANWKKLQ